jgi:hypothetical protein
MLLIGVTKQRRQWVKAAAPTPTYQISYPNISAPNDVQRKYLYNIVLHHHCPPIIVHLYGLIKRTKTQNGTLWVRSWNFGFSNKNIVSIF